MVQGARYKVRFRRRREGKTDYHRRYTYVLSKVTRIVIRRTNKYIYARVMTFNPKGDEVVVSSSSIELKKKYQWKGDGKNLSACYLTGYLLGKKAEKLNIEKLVVDLGPFKVREGGRIYAVIKGIQDAGLKFAFGDVEIDMNRIRGEHIAQYAKTLKETQPEKYQQLFSKYLKEGLNPEELTEHFDQIFSKIRGE